MRKKMDFTNIEINMFLGWRFNMYYLKHEPWCMVTFMALMNLIHEKRYRDEYTCFFLFNDILPEYLV